MRIQSPAKINLFLVVTGKRPDGYHELVSLISPISLFDTLHMQPGGKDITISCCHPQVPENESNLAYRAAKLFYQQIGRRAAVDIAIEKRIPVGAGLGGGSSNAAAVLRGLNQYYRCPFTPQELADMGVAVGADVPFFIFGVPALIGGIGERVTPYSIESVKDYRFVVIFPGFGVSTAMAYKNLDLGLTKCQKKLKSILSRNQTFNAAQHLCNDLETFTLTRYPEIALAKSALVQLGAQAALMSGSGSSVFGLYDDPRLARHALQKLGVQRKWQVFSVELTSSDDTKTGRPSD